MASETSATPALFLRNATGLVKGWSGFDAFAYSFMSVNLVTLGMFYSLAVFAYVPTASPVAVDPDVGRSRVTFLAIAYAGLIAAMPRAGGDYVWQSRVLDGLPGILVGAVVGGVGRLPRRHRRPALDSTLALGAGAIGLVVGGLIGRLKGGIGFVLAATGWWFILSMWAPIYGAILNIEFFQPLAALLGSTDGVSFFASESGILFVSLVDDRADVRPRRARHGRLRADPAPVPVCRPDRVRDHGRPDGHLVPGRLQGRVRPREPVACSASRTPTTRPSPTPPRTTPSRGRSSRSRWARTWARR